VADAPGSVDAAPETLSGLAWRSGVACTDADDFADWRDRDVDVYLTWVNRGNWAEIRNPDIYGAISHYHGQPGQVSGGIGMLPENGAGNFADCADGDYDVYFRDVGTAMVAAGRGDAIIRLGWEANGDWYVWSIGSGDPADYIACFRRQVAAIREAAPNILIEWTMNKDSHTGSRSVADAYPGDDVVDIVGVDFYDWWPAYPDAAAWNVDLDSTQNGGPRGIGAWLDFAVSHGKQLALPEWGVADGGGGGGFDNPYYIERMYEFFSENAAHISYEAYFNCPHGDPGVFMVCPESHNPSAGARYRSLYSP